jgi:hypothetical protein
MRTVASNVLDMLREVRTLKGRLEHLTTELRRLAEED